MNEIRVVFDKSIERTDSVRTFRFTTSCDIGFKAGQYLQLIFDEVDRRNRDLNKFLSLSSAPRQDSFEVTKRLSDSQFSKRLKQLSRGDELLVKAPMGKCVLHESHNKVLFLVGGIGITPVMSMLEDVFENNKKVDAVLVYANRHFQDVAFANILESWESEKENFNLINVYSDCEVLDAKCEAGTINHEILERRVADYKDRMIYVFGPSAMVNAVKGICREMGCDDSCLLTETFVGY